MSEAVLDFSRYAPAPHQPAPPPDEIVQAFRVIRAALGVIGQCLLIAVTLSYSRATIRLRETYHRVFGSLFAAWAFCGLGWGVSCGLSALMFFAR